MQLFVTCRSAHDGHLGRVYPHRPPWAPFTDRQGREVAALAIDVDVRKVKRRRRRLASRRRLAAL